MASAPFDFSPLWISLKVATTAIFFTFLLGVSAAYSLLHYRGKWKSVIDSILLAPLVLPPTVVGFLLLQLLGQYGWMGKLLQLFRLQVIFTWYAGAIAAVVVTFPLMYRTAQGAFEQVDESLLQVARNLGASELRIFWQIALPLALPGVLAGAMLAFARGLGEFGATLMIAGNIPQQTTTIPLAIYAAVEAGDYREAWLWTGVILSISFSAIAIAQVSRNQIFDGEAKLGYQKSVPCFQSQPFVRGKGKGEKGKDNLRLGSDDQDQGLVVDIVKELSEFDLQVSWQLLGRSVGILGASGAGKSMLLKCIAGIEAPSRGRIVVNGKVLFDRARKINLRGGDRRVGFLFQNYALFPHLTVAANLAFGLPKGLTDSQIQQRVSALLHSVDLQGMGDRYPHQLSGGQQQRVAFARAIANQPDILLLDEPFSALDTHLRSQMELELMAMLSKYQGITLLVTHNIEEAYRICESLLILEHGQVIRYGAKSEVIANPLNFQAARLTGCHNFSPINLPANWLSDDFVDDDDLWDFVEDSVDDFVEAIAWECQLQVNHPAQMPDPQFFPTHIGIHAHHIQIFTNSPPQNSTNTFPCWLVRAIEMPHSMTLYLKLNHPPTHDGDYHLQTEVFLEKWHEMQQYHQPWQLYLDPALLLFVAR